MGLRGGLSEVNESTGWQAQNATNRPFISAGLPAPMRDQTMSESGAGRSGLGHAESVGSAEVKIASPSRRREEVLTTLGVSGRQAREMIDLFGSVLNDEPRGSVFARVSIAAADGNDGQAGRFLLSIRWYSMGESENCTANKATLPDTNRYAMRAFGKTYVESGREDSNFRPLGPEPSALTRLSYAPLNLSPSFYSANVPTQAAQTHN